jgi:hypothetical protein
MSLGITDTPVRPRRGAAAVYLVVALTAMIALCSLAADYGRVQLVRAELQRAADAAARAAVSGVATGVSAAIDRAATYAAANLVDGHPAPIDTARDVEFGNWDRDARTFTPLNGGARGGANAVRVSLERSAARGNPVALSFAGAIGRGTCDVRVSAIATLPPAFGLIGLDSVNISGFGSTDSFTSDIGPYSTTNRASRGSIASNGQITLTGNAVVDGDAHPGRGKTVQTGGNAVVTGQTTPLTAPLAFPAPALPGSFTNIGALSVSSGNYTVAPGDYYCTSINISNNATFDCLGPVRVFCSGTVNITGGSIKTYQNRPANFQLLMLNGSAVSFSGQAGFYGTVYAPQSAFSQSGKADLYGSVVARSLTFSGTWQGGVHYDEALGAAGAGIILLVR